MQETGQRNVSLASAPTGLSDLEFRTPKKPNQEPRKAGMGRMHEENAQRPTLNVQRSI